MNKTKLFVIATFFCFNLCASGHYKNQVHDSVKLTLGTLALFDYYQERGLLYNIGDANNLNLLPLVQMWQERMPNGVWSEQRQYAMNNILSGSIVRVCDVRDSK